MVGRNPPLGFRGLGFRSLNKYRELPKWLQRLMRISSALLVALGCAAPAGKFYRPPSCYHCLQEEARVYLGGLGY